MLKFTKNKNYLCINKNRSLLMPSRGKTISAVSGLLLLTYVICCRFFTPLAEFYSLHCYPLISAALSLAASVFPFSLEEIAVLFFVFVYIFLTVKAFRKEFGFFGWLGRMLLTTVWLIVWIYMGWGNNYFRLPLYERAGVERSHFQKQDFLRFLDDYTAGLDSVAGAVSAMDAEMLRHDIRDYYNSCVAACGYAPLRSWQKEKRPLLNPLYSAVGVMGFVGPFFCESQVNLDLPPEVFTGTLAHEMAHLTGVTSEAEANYWAWEYCSHSEDEGVRYSGCLFLLPYVLVNAGALLDEAEYGELLGRINPEAIRDYKDFRKAFDARRVGLLDKIQTWMMDMFLKSNRVSSGASDYVGVIGMIMTMDYGIS